MTPVEELFQLLWDTPKDKLTWFTIRKQMMEKEKEVMVDFAYRCRNVMAADEFAITHWYDKTFNNEKF